MFPVFQDNSIPQDEPVEELLFTFGVNVDVSSHIDQRY